MAERFAVQNLDVLGDLEGDAVAVVVPGDAVPDDGVARVVEVDRAAAAAVDVRVLVPVAVHGEVFEDDALGLDGAQDGEAVADAGVLPVEVVVLECHRSDAEDLAFDRAGLS